MLARCTPFIVSSSSARASGNPARFRAEICPPVRVRPSASRARQISQNRASRAVIVSFTRCSSSLASLSAWARQVSMCAWLGVPPKSSQGATLSRCSRSISSASPWYSPRAWSIEARAAGIWERSASGLFLISSAKPAAIFTGSWCKYKRRSNSSILSPFLFSPKSRLIGLQPPFCAGLLSRHILALSLRWCALITWKCYKGLRPW